jgi:5'-nucleotidase
MRKHALIIWLSFSVLTNLYADPAQKNIVELQVLGINDFHGNIEPPAGSGGMVNGILAGGVEHLSTHIKNLRRDHEFSITVSAGDLVGATPLLSALFKDEPTIEAMNELRLDLNAVGNHEFDKGWYELLRLQTGFQHNPEPFGERTFVGANFKFLAANVIRNDTGLTLFPGADVRDFGPVKVAFIGIVLEGVEQVTVKKAVAGLTFKQEAATVNAMIPGLLEQGVKTVVLLIHEGGFPTGGFNECPGISGPIVDIVNHLDEHVGVVLSGHTHKAYNCKINNKIVTSAASNGRLVTEIYIDIDKTTGEMLSARANNIIVTRDVAKDPAQTAIIEKYQAAAGPMANEVIGHITEDISKTINQSGESTLGRLLADAQLEAAAMHSMGMPAVAFVNPGGIRTDLSFAQSPAGEGDGNVTYSEAYAVQPFGNNLVTMTLTGEQILGILEQQFQGVEARILQISRNSSYSYNKLQPPGLRINPLSVIIDGHVLLPTAKYRVTANIFLADGGDGFTGFKQGTDRITGIADLDALVTHLKSRAYVTPKSTARIVNGN